MIKLNAATLPIVSRVYSVTRKTVWHSVDPYNIVIYISKGICEIEINNITHHLKEDDYIIIPKGTIYTRRPVNNQICSMSYIHFFADFEVISLEQSQEEIIELFNHINKQFVLESNDLGNMPKTIYASEWGSIKKTDLIRFLFKKAESEIKILNPHSSLLLSGILCQILALISKYSIEKFSKQYSQYKNSSIPKTVRYALDYIHNHYSEKISIEDICKYCNISSMQLNRHFHNYLNTSLYNYVINYKLNKASEMLQNAEEMSIKEISLAVGFEDQCYFSRIFKRTFGESPNQFRNRVLNFNEQNHLEEITNN